MFLDEYIDKIILSREQLKQYIAPTIIPSIPYSNERATYDLKWRNGKTKQPQLVTVADSRDVVMQRLQEYYTDETGDIFLLTPDPGQGKSTTAIRFAQQLAMRGKRVLYLMPRHNYWNDIVNNSFTKINLWHHWLSVDGIVNDEPLCKFHVEAKAWTGKGYKLIDQCKALCQASGHMSVCPYRQQRLTPKRIIAGVHNHLATGLAITDFDVVFVDELPISAFVDERNIQTKFLDIGASGRVKLLIDKLTQIALNAETGEEIKGLALISQIADLLPDIYDNINLAKQWLPVPPDIQHPSDIFMTREWYIYDLLLLLMPEFYAYKAGRQSWLERVSISRAGLKLKQKKELWEKLPNKIIVMDGTGDPSVYRILFNREVRHVNPPVERKGRFYQITERSFNISAVMDRHSGKLKQSGIDMMELSKLVAESKPLPNGMFGKYNNIGIVTFKKLRPYFEALYGVENVLHFGGNRGTNQLIGVDCVMVLGTPSPPDNAMIDLMAQLSFNGSEPHMSRVEPYEPIQTQNGMVPVRSLQEVDYVYDNDGMIPYRTISGFWNHPELQAVYSMFREGEIKQSGHRGRPLTQDCDVWLLTSIPIKERMDGVWHSSNDCLNLPRDVHWSRWAALHRWLKNETFFVPIQTIAEKENVSRQWATRWAESIMEWKPHKWQLVSDPNAEGRGRPQNGLLRIS